jgi:hypothetical protein
MACSAFYFSACQKDNFLNSSSSHKVSVSEAKAWFDNQIQTISNVGNNDSTQLLINPIPQWDESRNDANKQGQEFLISPIKSPLSSIERGGTKLLIHQKEDGSFEGFYAFFVADSLYDVRTKGLYKLENYTGSIIYIDLLGKVKEGFLYENGKIVGNSTARKTSKIRGDTNLQTRGIECYSYVVTSLVWVSIAYRGYWEQQQVTVTECHSSGGFGGFSGSIPQGGSGGNLPASLFSQTQLDILRDKYILNGLEEIWDNLRSDQELLQATNSFLDNRGWNSANKSALMNLLPSSTDAESLKQHLSLMAADTDYYNFNKDALFPLTDSEAYRTVLKNHVGKAIEQQLRQLAIDNTPLTSPGFEVFKNIILKVLKKKVPDCIPGYGTFADLTQAYTAYQIGDYKTAGINVATAIIDLVPPAKLVKLVVNAADIFLTVGKVTAPVIKLYNRLAGRFDNVFDSFFRTFDDLDMFDGIEVSTVGGSVLNISVDLKGKSTTEILNYLGGILGKVWIPNSGSNNILGLDISSDIRLVFNPLFTMNPPSPTIIVFYDSAERIKIRLK